MTFEKFAQHVNAVSVASVLIVGPVFTCVCVLSLCANLPRGVCVFYYLTLPLSCSTPAAHSFKLQLWINNSHLVRPWKLGLLVLPPPPPSSSSASSS